MNFFKGVINGLWMSAILWAIIILLLTGCVSYGPGEVNPQKYIYYWHEQAPGYDLMGNPIADKMCIGNFG